MIIVSEASGEQQESGEDRKVSGPYRHGWQAAEIEVHLRSCPGFSY